MAHSVSVYGIERTMQSPSYENECIESEALQYCSDTVP